VRFRYYLDPAKGEPNIHGHNVRENEVEEVLARPIEDRLAREQSRVAVGQTETGRYLRVIDVPDSQPDTAFHRHRVRSRSEGRESSTPAAPEEEMKQPEFPQGWDTERVRRVLEHYERQSDEEAVAEDEAGYESTTHTAMEIRSISSQKFANFSPSGEPDSSEQAAYESNQLRRTPPSPRPKELNRGREAPRRFSVLTSEF
jgi:hypothetical protein